ncbi:hypothetical protein [Dishui Lake phycodnavirus 4]|jgi:hypothetical protein|nr:hypothetical protein [Dishui Lake phycodnavirus 4]
MLKFSKYPNELLVFFQTHNIKEPNIYSLKGQALALMSQQEFVNGSKFIDRKFADNFFKVIGFDTTDAIQAFNKPAGNLKLVKYKKGLYSLLYPFEIDFFQIEKRKNVHTNILVNGDKSCQVKRVKEHWKEKVKIEMRYIELLLSLKEPKLYDMISIKLNEVKWIMKFILEPEQSEWQIGHLDADKGNNPENLRFQPPIQARFRDKYIFNELFERLKK